MFQAFENLRTLTRTLTNIRLFLDEPGTPEGQFTKYLTSILEGTMEVFTEPQVQSHIGDVGPLFILPWHVGDMPSEGESDLGIIKMMGNPDLLTTGVIRQNLPSQEFPATLEAAVYQQFEIPGIGTLHNKYPVIIEGVVDSIPPFQTMARCRSAYLYDDNDKLKGVIGGRSLTLLGPA